MDVPDVYRERRRIEVVCHEVVVTDASLATLGRKAERKLESVPDVHHTRRMERICKAERGTGKRALAYVQNKDDDDPEPYKIPAT